MNCDKHIDMFVIIADRKKKDEIVALIVSKGGRIINTVYAKGSVKANSMQYVFGFVPEENKIIVTCLLNTKKAEDLLETLNTEYQFNKPNTGIAFTVPVDGLSY